MSEQRLDLVQRLRGYYTVPLNDGAGLLDGKDMFTRKFEPSPIQVEAADRIERLESLLDQSRRHYDELCNEINNLRNMVTVSRQSIRETESTPPASFPTPPSL